LLRLYCFHHAGANGTAFLRWRHVLDGIAEVEVVSLPGRGARCHEPRITTADALLQELRHTIGPPPVRHYALYGHSLGGLVAYAAAAAWRDEGASPAELLIVGATQPPDGALPIANGAEPGDEQLLDLLGLSDARRLPRDLLRRHVLPTLSDDLRLARALRAAASQPVDVPVLTVAGTGDALCPPSAMTGWQRWTTSSCTHLRIPGDHCFVRDRELPYLIRGALTKVAHAPKTPGSGRGPDRRDLT
jgi:surfactin synthase thioesterase subunit